MSGFDQGAILTRKTGSGILFYEEYTTTNLYVERTFGNNANSVTVTNDSATDTISLSWNGSTLIADVKPNETVELTTRTRSSVYVKGSAGGGNVRIWAT